MPDGAMMYPEAEEPSPNRTASAAPTYYPRLKRVDEYVRQHLSDPITLRDAARIAALEPKYFSKYFKDKIGTTFTNWLHDKRIEEAKRILSTESISIQRLGYVVGYSNPRTFRSAFKKRTGLTPSEFKARVRSLRKRHLRD
jgi:two-component system response regulator YesN